MFADVTRQRNAMVWCCAMHARNGWQHDETKRFRWVCIGFVVDVGRGVVHDRTIVHVYRQWFATIVDMVIMKHALQ